MIPAITLQAAPPQHQPVRNYSKHDILPPNGRYLTAYPICTPSFVTRGSFYVLFAVRHPDRPRTAPAHVIFPVSPFVQLRCGVMGDHLRLALQLATLATLLDKICGNEAGERGYRCATARFSIGEQWLT